MKSILKFGLNKQRKILSKPLTYFERLMEEKRQNEKIKSSKK